MKKEATAVKNIREMCKVRKWLKDMRKERKLSQDAIAKKLGIGQQYYSAIENGERMRDMPISMARKLAEVFMVSIDKILEMERGDKLNQIKKLREEKNMTQFGLAEALNVSQSAIALWETGKSRPSTYKLPELAKILGCSIDDLFE